MHAAPTTAAVAMPAAVTHDDLSLRKAHERRAARSSGQVAVALVALSVICGLVAFILCLAAEGSRSEARRHRSSRPITSLTPTSTPSFSTARWTCRY
jgi:hypothetical protein